MDYDDEAWAESEKIANEWLGRLQEEEVMIVLHVVLFAMARFQFALLSQSPLQFCASVRRILASALRKIIWLLSFRRSHSAKALSQAYDRASIIAACRDPLPQNIVSRRGKRVVKISDQKIANMLDYFASLRTTSGVPGSLCGGFSRGLMFPDTADLAFDSVDALEKWFQQPAPPS